MKYQVGDLLMINKFKVHPSLQPRPRLRGEPRPRLLFLPHPRLNNTFGIITAVEKHNDIFESGSNENDNGYIWYSQVDNTEYYFFEDEVVGEVL